MQQVIRYIVDPPEHTGTNPRIYTGISEIIVSNIMVIWIDSTEP